mmetsp:Transcript_77292/g.205145  ORF Transcript_77292/g.205145 Transcript_77292/m.205145 type:complete len:258 (-) Transcript_77292:1168-1941(-)
MAMPRSTPTPQNRPSPFASGPIAGDMSWSVRAMSGCMACALSSSTAIWKATIWLCGITTLSQWTSVPSDVMGVKPQLFQVAVTKYFRLMAACWLVHVRMPVRELMVVTVISLSQTLSMILNDSPMTPLTVQFFSSPRWSGPQAGTLSEPLLLMRPSRPSPSRSMGPSLPGASTLTLPPAFIASNILDWSFQALEPGTATVSILRSPLQATAKWSGVKALPTWGLPYLSASCAMALMPACVHAHIGVAFASKSRCRAG